MKTQSDDEKLIEAWNNFKKAFLKPFIEIIERLIKKFSN